jgi:NAD(P)-dependent dehydrogenase (short-subunit alcohol dehydrogenase family)
MTSLVEGDYSKMKKLIDINLGGVMLINRVFHPLLCDGGRILIVTSEVAGLDPLPFNGLYTVSKTALDSYAQALRQELNLIGQKVITVRPGAIETPLAKESISATEKLAASTKLYSKGAGKFSGIAKRFMGKPISPERIGALIVKALLKKRPRPTYSKHRNPGLILLGVLPIGLQCRIIKMLLK